MIQPSLQVRSLPHSSLVITMEVRTVNGEGSGGGNQPTLQNTLTNLENCSHGQESEALPVLVGRGRCCLGSAGEPPSSPRNRGSCCHLVATPCSATLPHTQRLPLVLPLRVTLGTPLRAGPQ